MEKNASEKHNLAKEQKTTIKKLKKRKRPMNSKQRLIIIGVISVLVILLLSGCVYAYSVYKSTQEWNKKTMFVQTQEDVQEVDNIRYITVNGQEYYLNENIVTVLMLGIDKTAREGFNGQCDAIAVVAVDTENNTLKMINIPRDTMSEVVRQDDNGNFYDEQVLQLALAYAYGTSAENSLKLSQRAVSNFLYGVPITKAVAFKIDGIEKANDLVGGVTLTLLDDFSMSTAKNGKIYSEMKKGATVHLDGAMAHMYVRYRDTNVATSSMDRLKRQVQYIKAYFPLAKQKTKENPMFAINAYCSMAEYLESNLNLQEIAFLANSVFSMNITDNTFISVSGELVQGEEFMEFYANEDELLQTVLDVFYLKKDNK